MEVDKLVGRNIKAFGQDCKIEDIVMYMGGKIIMLTHPIVVPTEEYTRYAITLKEIDEFID